MRKIAVQLGPRSYQILIGPRLARRLGDTLRRLEFARHIVVITNARLRTLYGSAITRSLLQSGFSPRIELLPDSEKAKSERTVARIIERMSTFDKGRGLAVVAVGGGVVGDSAGFIAAVYKRGVPYAQVPTTLLAQVDSAIGGKVAIDLPVAKNLVGAFYQPRLVLSDISILASLPRRQIVNGLAEVIKYGVALDAQLFAYVESHLEALIARDRRALEYIVYRSSLLKARIVERDERDTKEIRMVLNYGHTIGHAIEAASGYSRRYAHGEAVAIGMLAANRIAHAMGLLAFGDAGRIEDLVRRAGLPTSMKGLDLKKVYEALRHDKKFSERANRFVLPLRIGKATVVSAIEESLVRNALRGT